MEWGDSKTGLGKNLLCVLFIPFCWFLTTTLPLSSERCADNILLYFFYLFLVIFFFNFNFCHQNCLLWLPSSPGVMCEDHIYPKHNWLLSLINDFNGLLWKNPFWKAALSNSNIVVSGVQRKAVKEALPFSSSLLLLLPFAPFLTSAWSPFFFLFLALSFFFSFYHLFPVFFPACYWT